jgi:hypothetical protein
MTRCAGLQYENKAMVDFLTYDNSAYGIKIKYPSNWSFEYGVNPVCDTVIDIIGIYPPIAIDSNIITYLQVGIGCKITTIDLLARNAINGWRANQDFELVSANAQTNLAGRPGYAIVFKHLYNGLDSKTLQLGTISDNKGLLHHFYYRSCKIRCIPSIGTNYD